MSHLASRILAFESTLAFAAVVACCSWTTTSFAAVVDVNTTIDVHDSDACPGARLSVANRGDESIEGLEVLARLAERATRVEKAVLRPGDTAVFRIAFCTDVADAFPSGIHPLTIELRFYDAGALEHVDLRVVPVRVGPPVAASLLKIDGLGIDGDAAFDVRNAALIARDLEARLLVSLHAGTVGPAQRVRLGPGERKRIVIALNRGLRDVGPEQNGFVLVQWREQGRVWSEIAAATFTASPSRPGGRRAGVIVAVVLLVLFTLICRAEFSPTERAAGWERFKRIIRRRWRQPPS
jgi:hypothetical protein